MFFFLMLRRPPKSTRTDTLFPATTLFRSAGAARVRQCVTRVASAAGGPAAQPSPAIAISPAPEERQRRALPPGRFLAPGISGLRFRARDIGARGRLHVHNAPPSQRVRSEEHTSELQSLMRNSYAVFCLKK